MRTLWSRVSALCLLLAVLTVGMPTVSVTAHGEIVSEGYDVLDPASQPIETEAASILGISTAQVAALRADMLAALRNCEAECDIARYGIVYSREVNECLSGLIRNTMPEVLHISNWAFYHHERDGHVITRIGFTDYTYSKSEYQMMLQRCETVAEYMTRDLVNSDLTEVHKALLLHDRLAAWVDYDNASALAGNVPYECHTMYGALYDQVAVCDGYAKAYIYLLRRVGIESFVCRSGQLNHAWNVVKVENKWYHVDVTWDDPVWDVTGRVNHENFLRSSDGIYSTGHTATDYNTTPTDTKFESQNWPWNTSTTAFQYVNGRLYYVDNDRELLRYWEGDTLYNAISVEDTWRASATQGYTKNYTRLSADEQYLYYSLSKAVYRYDPVTGTSEQIYTPDFSYRPYHNIYGMIVRFDVLYCDVTDKPKFDVDTKALRQERVRYRENQVTHISIERLPYKLTYSTGEPLDTQGLQIKVWNANGTVQTLTEGFTVEGFDTTAAGERTLTVRYGGKETTFTVNVSPKMYGNVDKDGAITSTDARLVLQYAVQKINVTDLDTSAADVNRDGVVNSTDARLILQYAVKTIDTFPAAK